MEPHLRRERSIGLGRCTLRYHAVDKRGWTYLCGCAPAIRLGERINYTRTRKRQKYARWAGR